jgi:hypothetical protein
MKVYSFVYVLSERNDNVHQKMYNDQIVCVLSLVKIR